MALLNNRDPPRQLFISLSPMLVKNVQSEFEHLAKTFHGIYGYILPPENSNCKFISVLDLMLELDSCLDSRHRLFYGKGLARRFIHDDLDDDDADNSQRVTRLFTSDDIV